MGEEWWITTNNHAGTLLACGHRVSREEIRERADELLGFYIQERVPGDYVYHLRCSTCGAQITSFRLDRIYNGAPVPADLPHGSDRINRQIKESTEIFENAMVASRLSK
jgi:hypothetical protein